MLNSCERQDAASSARSAGPPSEHFGSQVPEQPQPIGGGGFSVVLHQPDGERRVESSLSTKLN